jgi:Protein of unknown function (DUF2892)
MCSATPRVGAEMKMNVSTSERTPRLVIAAAAGVAAALSSSFALKAFLIGSAAAMLATVATGYCPINAALDRGDGDAPQWRTLKTFRVEP